MHARGHPEDAALALVLRYLPAHRDVLLLAQHVERHRLARIVGAQNAHRLHRRSRLAYADRHAHVGALEGERRVFRRAHHEDAFAGPEVIAQIGIELHELDSTPRAAERPTHAHAFAVAEGMGMGWA